jgi:hypothetical protein
MHDQLKFRRLARDVRSRFIAGRKIGLATLAASSAVLLHHSPESDSGFRTEDPTPWSLFSMRCHLDSDLVFTSRNKGSSV